MSGICGFCSFSTDFTNECKKWEKVLENMLLKLKHRGGAFNSLLVAENFCFGETMRENPGKDMGQITKNEENYSLVGDFDIYNIIEISKTVCVEDAVLSLLCEKGLEGIDWLNGGFAGAFFHGGKNQTALFRDHAGVKPLFYTFIDNMLVFASEIKALTAFPGFKALADRESLCEIFGLGPARSELSGVFKGVESLLPGHIGVFSREGFQQKKYWSLESLPHCDVFEETVDNVRYLLTDAVRMQSRGDVCAFLSGGIDSSIVMALAAGFKDGALDTFSFDFKDNDANFVSNSFQPELDRPYVDIMVQNFKTNHQYLYCDTADLVKGLEKAVIARDLPGMADVDASLLYFCGLVKGSGKIALTGECADEIFAGYPWFHKRELYDGMPFPWSRDMEARTILLNKELAAALNIYQYAVDARERSLENMPIIYGESLEEIEWRRICWLTIKWFMATLGDRMDRMSQSSGLTARMPFADKRLLEYLWNVPRELKTKDGVVKAVLREACRGILPDSIAFRKKSPYPKTYNPLYEKALSDALIDVVMDPSQPVNAFLDLDQVLKFTGSPKDYGRPWYGQLMAGPQMMAYMLSVNFWLKEYKIEIVL